MILSLVLSRSSFDRMISERTLAVQDHPPSPMLCCCGRMGWMEGESLHDLRTNTGSCIQISPEIP